jgi:hypothetical protein
MWEIILGFLGPLLVQAAQQGCKKDPQQAAKEAYDQETDTFKEPAVRAAMIQTHHAIQLAKKDLPRKERRQHKFSKAEIRANTIAKMREGLTITPERTAAYAAQAAELPELDHDEGDDDN